MDNMRFHRGKMVVDDHEILIFQLEKGELCSKAPSGAFLIVMQLLAG